MNKNVEYRESEYKITNGMLSWKYLYNKENDKLIYFEDNGCRKIIMDI